MSKNWRKAGRVERQALRLHRFSRPRPAHAGIAFHDPGGDDGSSTHNRPVANRVLLPLSYVPYWRTVWELNPSGEFEGLATSPEVERFVLLPPCPARYHAVCEDTGARPAGRRHFVNHIQSVKDRSAFPGRYAGAVLQKPGAPPESRTRKIRFLRPARMPIPPAGQDFQNKKPGDLAVQSGLILH
jgi:hypothetical protein